MYTEEQEQLLKQQQEEGERKRNSLIGLVVILSLGLIAFFGWSFYKTHEIKAQTNEVIQKVDMVKNKEKEKLQEHEKDVKKLEKEKETKKKEIEQLRGKKNPK